MAPSKQPERSLEMTVLIHFQNQDHILNQNLWGSKEDLTRGVLKSTQMCSSRGILQGTKAVAAGQESGTEPSAGSASSLGFGVHLLSLFHATSQKSVTGLKCAHNYRVWTSFYLSSYWIPTYFLPLLPLVVWVLLSSVHTQKSLYQSTSSEEMSLCCSQDKPSFSRWRVPVVAFPGCPEERTAEGHIWGRNMSVTLKVHQPPHATDFRTHLPLPPLLCQK